MFRLLEESVGLPSSIDCDWPKVGSFGLMIWNAVTRRFLRCALAISVWGERPKELDTMCSFTDFEAKERLHERA